MPKSPAILALEKYITRKFVASEYSRRAGRLKSMKEHDHDSFIVRIAYGKACAAEGVPELTIVDFMNQAQAQIDNEEMSK